jgi:hypothetical protein
MFAAGEAINLILLVHRDRGNFLKRPVVGQLAPAFDDFIAIITASYGDAHGNLLVTETIPVFQCPARKLAASVLRHSLGKSPLPLFLKRVGMSRKKFPL